MIQFDDHIFQMGWNHQLEKLIYIYIHLTPVQPAVVEKTITDFLGVIWKYRPPTTAAGVSLTP